MMALPCTQESLVILSPWLRPGGNMTTNDPPERVPVVASGHEGPARDFGLPIVGVGASSGGLEACTRLFKHLPPNPGLCFLLVMHLTPHEKSHLPEVLAPLIPLPIVQAEEGMAVRADRII